VTRGQLPQRAGSLGLNGGGTAAAVLQKLAAYGLSGNLLSWIEEFLVNRKQVTRVGESLSDTVYLKSGIVQESCLGPLLFLLHVNDVTTTLSGSTTCKLYADDVCCIVW